MSSNYPTKLIISVAPYAKQFINNLAIDSENSKNKGTLKMISQRVAFQNQGQFFQSSDII